MDTEEQTIESLIRLHSGLERQGPGDARLSDAIIRQLPALPQNPGIADIGCGAGAGALMLARKYRSRVKAVDFSKPFLDQMMERARQQGLESLIEPICHDMGNLDWNPGSIHLLWSEGAAYNITFEGALKAWRPLMATGGIAVISEMSYFSDDPPAAVVEAMKQLYPGIRTESENMELINTSGFEMVTTHQLSTKAWWESYYDPLHDNITTFRESGDAIMQAVIEETEAEMALFRQYHQHYGYTFYIMLAV